MTAIFTVTVDSVEGRTLRGRVHIINPDVPFVPDDATFPVALLTDVWWHLAESFLRNEGDAGSGGERYPFSEERGKEIVAHMWMRDEYPQLMDLLLGKTIRVTADGDLLADDGRTVLEPRRKAKDVYELDSFGGAGFDGISDYVQGASDFEEFRRRAYRIVESYDVGPVRNIPLDSEVVAFDDEGDPWYPERVDREADLDGRAVWKLLKTRPFDERPCADITVTVRDAGYLEHMVAGLRWSTTHTGV